jgi:carboxylesterase type B
VTLEEYPCQLSDCRAVAAQVVGDYFLKCPTHAVLRSHSRIANVSTFNYRFDHTPSFPDPVGNAAVQKYLGAFHGSEVPFCFNNVNLVEPNITQEELQLGADLSTAWMAFADAGDPSIGEQTLFVPFNEGTNWSHTLVTTGRWTVEQKSLQQCEFWFSIYEKYFS